MNEYQFEMRGEALIKRQRLNGGHVLVGLVSPSFKCIHCKTYREWRKTKADESSDCILCAPMIAAVKSYQIDFK